MAQWTAHPDCPKHLKPELEKRVKSLPSSFLVAPETGEVFENANLCQERLQGWELSQVFAVIRTSGVWSRLSLSSSIAVSTIRGKKLQINVRSRRISNVTRRKIILKSG
jgi:hypothetical protein